jgi:hypothetical protein
MAISYPNDVTQQYKQNIYNIPLDVSGWNRMAITVVNPAAPIHVYGSNDAGAIQGETFGNAELAINFTALQITNMASGVAGATMAATGNYKLDIYTRFVKLMGMDAEKIIIQNTKEI